jgi:DNA-binding XRE family transcriptional regulator
VTTAQPPMADGVPGRQHLTGYRLRDYDHFIATLCESRRDRDITQDQIAAHMGLSQATVGRILDGDGGRTLWRAFALANALGYDLALIPREDAP